MGLLALFMALSFATAPTAWADECPAGGLHDFEAELLIANSDDADGLQRFTCLKCGYSYDEVIPATGHVWGPWQTVVEPTCEEPGLERRVCESDASHVEERTIPALSDDGSHAWAEAERHEAGCEADGWVSYRCTRCGAEMTEALPALGHDWGDWETVAAASAGREGLEQRVCARDASHVEQRAVPALEGAGGSDVKPATETAVEVEAKQADAASGPSPEGEPADPWAPNALDAALLGADLAGAALFAFLMAPLVHARRWVLDHRAMAKAAAAWKEQPHDRS